MIYDENRIGFDVQFENPKFISMNGIDTLKVTFSSTNAYLSPLNESLKNIPDGFTLTI